MFFLQNDDDDDDDDDIAPINRAVVICWEGPGAVVRSNRGAGTLIL